MKKLTLTLVSACLVAHVSLSQNVLKAKTTEISFFSSTPIEDINANSKKGVSAINLSTGQVYMKVPNTTFEFKAKLMQEHFNENYMESEKYPFSEFSGKIVDKIDLSKSGTYNVTVEGKLNMHGVVKDYKTQALIINDAGKLSSTSNFKVKLTDHDIKVPSLVFEKIAEVIDVKIQASYN